MTTEPVTIELRGPPQGKGRGRVGRGAGGRPVVFTPAATRSYEGMLRLAAAEAMRGRLPIDGPILLEMVATFPVPASWSVRKRQQALDGILSPTTKPDADNLLKVVDALNEIVWRDDKQIVVAMVTKRYGAEPGLSIKAQAA